MTEWKRITEENAALRHRIAQLEAIAASLETYIRNVRASSSWRLTAPVRGGKRTLQALANAIGPSVSPGPVSPRPALVRLARKIARWAADKPAIKKVALPILLRNAALESKTRALLAREHPALPPSLPSEALPALSPPASPDHPGTPISLVARSLSPAERIIEAAIRRAQTRAR
jgi:hypothetical protein